MKKEEWEGTTVCGANEKLIRTSAPAVPRAARTREVVDGLTAFIFVRKIFV